jgi:hypothetical protein
MLATKTEFSNPTRTKSEQSLANADEHPHRPTIKVFSQKGSKL